MRSFKAVCSLALMSFGIASADDDCKYALEIVQLQDASDTLKDDVEMMKSVSKDLFTQLNAAYPGVRYGLSSFTDKPMPISGYGDYGAWAKAGFIQDYCYQNNMDFATTAEELVAALDKIQIGSGADLGEAMLEAMIYAVQDKALSWSTQQYSPDGRPIVKFIVQITDGYPHAEGDAAGNALCWNWERTYPTGPDGPSTGGYGASDLNTKWQPTAYYVNQPDQYTGHDYEPDWQRMSHLLSRIDNDIQLTDDEMVELRSLNETFGPSHFMEPVSPHPGAWDPLDCHHVEYPSPAITANVLVEHNVFPIVLIADPGIYYDGVFEKACGPVGIDYVNHAQDCLLYMWQNTMTEMGITGVVAKLGTGSEDIVQIMLDSIKNIVQEVCLLPTTTAAPTVPTAPTVIPIPPTVAPTEAPATTTTTTTTTKATTTTTTKATTTTTTKATTTKATTPKAPTPAPTDAPSDGSTPAPTDAPSDGSTPAPTDAPSDKSTVAPTGAPTDAPTVAPDAPTTASTKAPGPVPTDAGDATTANMRGSTTTPVVAAGGGSNTAVVAAAGAGAAAAVAAAGAFAYTKFGAGFMGKSVPQGLDAVQQVDIPESPLEREAMEEVTMDMFQ